MTTLMRADNPLRTARLVPVSLTATPVPISLYPGASFELLPLVAALLRHRIAHRTTVAPAPMRRGARPVGTTIRPWEPDELLTMVEAAAYLVVSARTMRRLARSGKVAAYRPGHQIRFRRSDLDVFRSQTTPPGTVDRLAVFRRQQGLV